MDFCFEDFINQAVLLCNRSRPLTRTVASERFGMSCSCERMYCYLVKKLDSLLKCGRLTSFQLGKPLLSAWRIGNRVHRSERIKPSVHLIQIGKGSAFATLDLFACLVNASKELFLCHQCVILLLGCPRGLLQTGCKPFTIAGCKRETLDVIPQVIHCNGCHNALT